MIKKNVEWTEGKIIKFILPETHRERMGEAGEKRTRGDSQWYLYKDWSAAKIIDLSIFLPSSRFPSCRFFLLYPSLFLPTYLSPSSIYNIYLSLLSLSLSLESRVLNTRGKVDLALAFARQLQRILWLLYLSTTSSPANLPAEIKGPCG